MKISIKKQISDKEADILIEKYYEGFTSNQEEEKLRVFLNQSNLPDKYSAEKAISGFFESTGEKSQKSRATLKWIYRSSAVAIIVFLIGFSIFEQIPETKNYAYVNGEKVTGIENVQSLANESLNSVSDDNNKIMNEQLDQFSNIKFN